MSLRLWRLRKEDSYALLGLMAMAGYAAYGLVSFQQTVSTPLLFAVLGMSEAATRKNNEF